MAVAMQQISAQDNTSAKEEHAQQNKFTHIWVRIESTVCVERQIAVQLFVAAVSSAVGKEGGSNGSGSQLKEVAGKGGLWELEGNEEAMECRLNSPDGEDEREDISSLSTCYNAANGGFGQRTDANASAVQIDPGSLSENGCCILSVF